MSCSSLDSATQELHVTLSFYSGVCLPKPDRPKTEQWSPSAKHSQSVMFCAHGHPILSTIGLLRELNPGPLAPEARIIPLDQAASDVTQLHMNHSPAAAVLINRWRTSSQDRHGMNPCGHRPHTCTLAQRLSAAAENPPTPRYSSNKKTELGPPPSQPPTLLK